MPSLPLSRQVLPPPAHHPVERLGLRGNASLQPPAEPPKPGGPAEQPPRLPAERLPGQARPLRVGGKQNRHPEKPAPKALELVGLRGRVLPNGPVEQREDEARGRLPDPELALHEKELHEKELGEKPQPPEAVAEREAEREAQYQASEKR